MDGAKSVEDDKTQLIWLGTSQQLWKVSVTELTLPSGQIQFLISVTNLGLHIDSELTMLPHIDSVCRTGFFQLRQLRTVQGSLTTECAQTIVHSFIHRNNLREPDMQIDCFRRTLKTCLFDQYSAH